MSPAPGPSISSIASAHHSSCALNPTGDDRPHRSAWASAALLAILALSTAGLATAQTFSFEAENLTYTTSGATASVQNDTNSSGGHWIQLAATSAGSTIDFAIPSLGAGTYQLQMEWKGNNNRGILMLSIDGAVLGGTLDQYSSGQTYPTTTFGTVIFSVNAAHTIRLTAAGKNAASSNYYLSADRFIFISQTNPVAAPTFTPGGGSYSSPQSVTISTTTAGASIRYTTNGSTPTSTTGTLYTGPVSISSTTTLQAIAYATGMSDSSVTSATYSFGTVTPNGNPILPPKWAFGVLFGCYDNQTAVLNDMTRLRNGFCGDLIWVDSSWLSSNYNGPASAYIDFKFDSSQFADPATMIATLHSNHFHFGVWEWPWIDQSNSLYSTGASKHYFIENSSGAVVNGGGWHGVTFTGQFDLSTSPSVTWWKSLNQPLFNMGFDFLKMDTTVGIPSGGILKNGSTSNNDWRGFYHKAAWEITSTANQAQGRGFLLAHSDTGGATNNDQYPGLWTGDSSASFSSLVSKDMGGGFKCNTKSTGAYWCGDIGGYNNNSNDELYQRWLEYGCFNPLTEFFGAKGTTGSNSNLGRFPWCFSTAAQATFTKYTQLRYQLLPFRYSNAQACYHITGGAVQYPVWWPNNKQIINGQGASEILVQPVTAAAASGATTTSVSVTFPEASSVAWVDYWNPNGATHNGGSSVTLAEPFDVVPMYVKAGSIIPMLVPYDSQGKALPQQYVDQYPADPLTLDIYPAGSTSYTLYEDDGISDLYISGEYARTTFTSNNTSGHEVVTIGAATGSYVGQLTARTYELKVNQQSASPASVVRDGVAMTNYTSRAALETATSGWFYDGTAKIVWVKFDLATNAATSVTL
jgi:alpha-glucosidase (family GH31 glycosyl hydrolase)